MGVDKLNNFSSKLLHFWVIDIHTIIIRGLSTLIFFDY